MFKILFVALLTASSAQAQDSVVMETVRIDDENPAETVIQGEHLNEKQARDLEDTFRDTPEVVVGGSARNAQKVYVRGLEDTNLNVTVDGARQAGYLFHHQGRLNIDPELLKQVEVEAGTGNALSGPGALGGALRFVTKDAEDLLLPGQTAGALLKTWYASNNDERGASLGLFAKPTDEWSGLLYGTFTENLDSKMGGGNTIPYTSGKPQAALAKITYRPSVFHKLTFGTNFTSDNAQRLIRANFGYSPTQPIVDKVFETLNHTLNYDYNPGNENIHLVSDFYWADSKLKQASAGSSSTAQFTSRGLTLKNNFKRSYGRLTTGFDWNEDKAESFSLTQRGEETGRILGVFLQGNIELGESWLFSSGVRYDDYKLVSLGDAEFKDNHVSPNASLRYRWNENISSTLGWSQAFRGPVPAEVLLLANATGLAPTADLNGTVAETAELVNTFTDAASVFELSGFVTEIRDPLESSISAGLVTRRNAVDSIRVKGYQVKYRRVLGDVGASIYYAHSNTNYGDNAIGYTGNFGRAVSLGDRVGLNLDWKLVPQNLILGLNALWVMKLTDVPSTQVAQPGYDVYDLSAVWTPTERWRAGLSLHNVFDKKYIAQGSVYANATGAEYFLYEPGRDIRASLSYLF